MWNYTEAVHDHFLRPHNVGPLEGANAVGEVGSLACGDALKLYLKISEQGIIEDATFETFGCASAIASSSVLTDMIKGMSVEDALKISNKDIANALGGLPKQKMHCSVMGQEALEAALADYLGEKAPAHEPEGELVCKCFGVYDGQIRRAIRENKLTTVEEVTDFTKAGGGCGDCQEDIAQILKDVLAGKTPTKPLIPDMRPKEAKPSGALSNVQRMQRVMTVLEEIVRPRLQQDGGDIELVDIEGKTVVVALRGMCTSCPSSRLTIEGFVQQTLRDQVEADLTVREANQ